MQEKLAANEPQHALQDGTLQPRADDNEAQCEQGGGLGLAGCGVAWTERGAWAGRGQPAAVMG